VLDNGGNDYTAGATECGRDVVVPAGRTGGVQEYMYDMWAP